MTLKFIDNLDSLIFERFNPAHEPATGATVTITFIVGLVLGLVILVSQMFSMSNDTLEIIIGIAVAALLGFVGYMTYPTVISFNSWGVRIAYCLYSLIVFSIALTLSMWAFMLMLGAAVFYGVVKLFFSNDKSKKAKIRYSNGTEEEAEVETGLLGEKTYRGKDTGNTYQTPW